MESCILSYHAHMVMQQPFAAHKVRQKTLAAYTSITATHQILATDTLQQAASEPHRMYICTAESAAQTGFQSQWIRKTAKPEEQTVAMLLQAVKQQSPAQTRKYRQTRNLDRN